MSSFSLSKNFIMNFDFSCEIFQVSLDILSWLGYGCKFGSSC